MLLLALSALALAGCGASAGAGEQVRLVVTRVPPPTATPEALPTTQPVSYTVRTGGYPQQALERTVVAVDAEGHVIGVVWFRESDADWYPSYYVTCDTNVIF